ncbi:HPr(Ser) kinase/phosphatase [Thermoanaerobacterium sp. RBIITD]|uniref:HPr(Ser) kinase/phosphatase n=1 Tax=Thermoanaerobacterium sp. RBIITD TaxID=1550240 RepID=UPI000BB70EDB|nr:HPr(Ser) kinase/phosphatase [Thermoanaerobacterium sp. RBIITD]SNX54620.1 Hpr(Ser) kinase/phosphatase [Thermoanaerobacterium sp. RBIITD]
MLSVSVVDLIKDLGLEVIVEAKEKIDITTSDVNRPGLQFSGFYEHFANERVQVLGMVETAFIDRMPLDLLASRADKFFEYPLPCVIVTRGLNIKRELIESAQKHDRYLLRTKESSTKFISRLINYLEEKLAPQITIHGDLVDVYGVGVLLLGESGIGKSETALELIKRGHRLVADDATEIKKISDYTLQGSSPEIIRHYIEIRGIGILDIKTLYGVGSVRDNMNIDLVIQLEEWNEDKYYDRLGLDDDYIKFFDIKIPKLTIPVRPGRNLAIIVEVAAMNHRQKQMGYNAAHELNKKLLKQISG